MCYVLNALLHSKIGVCPIKMSEVSVVFGFVVLILSASNYLCYSFNHILKDYSTATGQWKWSNSEGSHFNIKTIFPCKCVSILKIRQMFSCLINTMGIAIHIPDSKIHGIHVGPTNLVIRDRSLQWDESWGSLTSPRNTHTLICNIFQCQNLLTHHISKFCIHNRNIC